MPRKSWRGRPLLRCDAGERKEGKQQLCRSVSLICRERWKEQQTSEGETHLCYRYRFLQLRRRSSSLLRWCRCSYAVPLQPRQEEKRCRLLPAGPFDQQLTRGWRASPS